MISSDGPPEPPAHIFPQLWNWLLELENDSQRNPDGILWTKYEAAMRNLGVTRICDLDYGGQDSKADKDISNLLDKAEVPLAQAVFLKRQVHKTCKPIIRQWIMENPS